MSRRLAAFAIYGSIRVGLVPSLRLVGYRRVIIGSCTILAPPQQIENVLRGFEFLRQIDLNMYQNVTARSRYVCWYHKNDYARCKQYFTINDNFLLWGNAGVAACVVQSFVLSELDKKRDLSIKHGLPVEAYGEAYSIVYDWLSRYSFPSELVDQYVKT